MPIYEFRNLTTDECFTDMMSISSKEQFLADNPDIIQELSTPSFGDPTRLGVRKVDDSFNDVLKHVKSSHHGSIVNTKN